MIRRYAPPRKKRPGTRRGQATPEEITSVRLAVYERAGGRCELNLVADCIKGVLPYEGETAFDHGHAAHLKSKGAGGKWTMSNIRWSCHLCHLVGLHNPKPCPPKPK
jgi:hypothetical protein